MNDPGFITLITREGFWSSDARTFRRDQVKEIRRDHISASCSAMCPRGDYIELELKSGEIVKGREYPTY